MTSVIKINYQLRFEIIACINIEGSIGFQNLQNVWMAKAFMSPYWFFVKLWIFWTQINKGLFKTSASNLQRKLFLSCSSIFSIDVYVTQLETETVMLMRPKLQTRISLLSKDRKRSMQCYRPEISIFQSGNISTDTWQFHVHNTISRVTQCS